MNILEYLRNATSARKTARTSASTAKDRLQILISHESAQADPHFVQKLQAELMEVISRYVHIDPEQIKVQLERMGDQSVLELNVTLSNKETA